METESFNIQVVQCMTENGLMISLLTKVKLSTAIKINTKEPSKMEKSMAKGFITIVLEEDIKVNGHSIRNMDMVSSIMQTEINLKVNGKMGREMVRGAMNTLMEISMMVNGFLI